MHRKQRPRSHKVGGALISALFITALAAMLATALAVEQGMLIHETSLIVRADQGYLDLQGAQIAAKNIILNYASQWISKTPPSSIVPLKTILPLNKIDNMEISGVIENEQGKFNLNDLQYSQNQPRFVTLLTSLDGSVSVAEADNIAKAVTAWITSGSQDDYYLSLHPPYRSSKTQLVSVSELLLINGVTPEIYAALKPYVTALPEATAPIATPAASPQMPAPTLGTQVDVNAVSLPVLLALSPTINNTQAQHILACRQQYRGFASEQAFATDCGVQLKNITVNGHFFLVRISGVYGKRVLQLNSLMVTQTEKNNTLKVVTVWQSFE